MLGIYIYIYTQHFCCRERCSIWIDELIYAVCSKVKEDMGVVPRDVAVPARPVNPHILLDQADEHLSSGNLREAGVSVLTAVQGSAAEPFVQVIEFWADLRMCNVLCVMYLGLLPFTDPQMQKTLVWRVFILNCSLCAQVRPCFCGIKCLRSVAWVASMLENQLDLGSCDAGLGKGPLLESTGRRHYEPFAGSCISAGCDSMTDNILLVDEVQVHARCQTLVIISTLIKDQSIG